jgi:hypothetical protein
MAACWPGVSVRSSAAGGGHGADVRTETRYARRRVGAKHGVVTAGSSPNACELVVLKSPPSDTASSASGSEGELAAAVDALVDEYRASCLWSLREDYYPRTARERLHVLEAIERHGDLAGYRRASALHQWLSRTSSAPSASS